MARFPVTCRGEFSNAVVARLVEAGVYAEEQPEPLPGEPRHHLLVVEAGTAEDALLVARGAVVFAGGSGSEYRVG